MAGTIKAWHSEMVQSYYGLVEAEANITFGEEMGTHSHLALYALTGTHCISVPCCHWELNPSILEVLLGTSDSQSRGEHELSALSVRVWISTS